MTSKFYLIFLFVFIMFCSASQAQDSARVLTLQDFFALVLKNHPIAKQADLLDDRAKQELRIARGLLDPSINSKFYNKKFQSKEYYSLWDNTLKIPTWYGIDFKAGFERNSGPYVNRENYTSLQGLNYIGISVPIGQGLLIDERRSTIRQAQQLMIIATAERVKVLNKLLLQASKDYWDWAYFYQKYNLYKKGLEFATVRSNAVLERVKQGDLSSIDTVEAGMQVQNFQILLIQAEMDYKNESLILSNYLWNIDGAPVEITNQVIPSMGITKLEVIGEDSLIYLSNRAKLYHPDIIKLTGKLNQLNIEKRFISDKFKPKLNLEYNVLSKSFYSQSDIFTSNNLSNNYKVGASFSYPLFLRNERGKFQLTKIKVQETNLELQQSNREIQNSIQAAANEILYLTQQIKYQEKLVNNSELLRRGEQVRFENGESSIFLINSRESSLISNQVKFYEIISKYEKSKVMLQWSAGAVE